ncbi:MAG: YqgE/AlgH family protein [Acidimicrobiia bacterium]|jgi:putative transcriptional regulator
MSEQLTGMLLAAVPHMYDPHFARAVVLVCEHNEQGALGVIINRPTEAEVFEYLPDWVHLVAEPAVVFEGGPVEREVAIGLAATSSAQPDIGYRAISEGLGLFDLGSDPAEATGIDLLRVFSGYAGWEAGQLEQEIGAGGWFVLPAQPGDGFAVSAAGLWRETLTRQGGRLAVYANYPPDPTLN